MPAEQARPRAPWPSSYIGAILAALEAVIGLLIEISFIATFTQRFFGAK